MFPPDSGSTLYYEELQGTHFVASPYPQIERRRAVSDVRRRSVLDDGVVRDGLLVLVRAYLDVDDIDGLLCTCVSIGWTDGLEYEWRDVLARIVDLRALLHHRVALLGDTGGTL